MPMIAFIGVRISWLIVARNDALGRVGGVGLPPRRLGRGEQARVVERDRCELREPLEELDSASSKDPPAPWLACDAERADDVTTRTERNAASARTRPCGRSPAGPPTRRSHRRRAARRSPRHVRPRPPLAAIRRPGSSSRTPTATRRSICSSPVARVDVAVGRPAQLAARSSSSLAAPRLRAGPSRRAWSRGARRARRSARPAPPCVRRRAARGPPGSRAGGRSSR